MGAQVDVIDKVETTEIPLEYLEREICQLASNIAAATCRWLLLLAEFDRREGWAEWGARSCAEWLSWRCGIGRVAARDHLRVAHRLEELKLVREGFAPGELSYSKVRAITRVATPETEATLVELARHATANHMEQIARAYRGLKRRMAKDGKGGEEKDGVYLHWYWDDDGYLVIVGRFPPEEGAVFIEALNAARAALGGDADKGDAAADDSAEPRSSSAQEAEPRDSAESRTSSAGATEDSAEATSPDDSAGSDLETPHRDSAESRRGEEEDEWVNGYWMVPDDNSGDLAWVVGEMPDDDDSAEAAPGALDDDELDVPPAAASTRDSAEIAANRSRSPAGHGRDNPAGRTPGSRWR